MSKWKRHIGTEMPSELASAQIVEIKGDTGRSYWRSGALPWRSVDQYHPALTEDGLPYVSAEGLESWAEYVATDEGGRVGQYDFRPVFGGGYYNDLTGHYWSVPHSLLRGKGTTAPDTHAIPGPPENSLARVWRE